MSDIRLFGLLLGGLVIGMLTMLVLLLPFARRYFGRRTLITAAALPTLTVAFGMVGHPGLGGVVLVILATVVSFFLVLPPLLAPLTARTLRRPLLPALAIVVADGWNGLILVVASDPGFMGGSC